MPDPSFIDRLQSALAVHESGDLESAEAAYHALLVESPDHPDALHLLGLLMDQRDRLDEAVGWIRRAIAAAPQTGVFHFNLGNVLRGLGERDEGTARLEAAVEAFQAALEERPREQLPLDWAKTTGNLGIALRILGERTRDGATARRALDTIAAAEATLRAAGHAKADYYAGQIPAAEALVARLSEPRINT